MQLNTENVEAASRRTWIAGTLASTSMMHAQAPAASGARPNIIYLHSHDTGRYIQPYGHAVPTPNLAKLAGTGVLFRNAFDAAPTCSPARASLLTGHCPHSNGMLGLAHRGFVLNDYKQHLAHTLRPRGYQSTLIGIQHIAMDPATIGYDQVLESAPFSAVPQTRGVRMQDIVAAAVNKIRSRPKEPF